MPDGFGGFLGDTDHTAAVLGEFARNGWLNIVGGCCGTTPGMDRGHRPGGRGRPAAPGSRHPALVHLQRHGAAGDPPRDQLRHDRRADQHHRLEAVRPVDQDRRLRGRPGRGPRAGRGRRQHHRRQHGRGPDRRRAGHDPVPQPGLGRSRHRQGPDHGRQLEVGGHRGRAEVRPGQVDRQLDQPQGRRGGVPPPGPAGPSLRRRGRRHGLRRGGPGRHQGPQGRDLPARLQAADRAGRLPARGHHLRRRTSSPSAPASRSTTTTPSSSSRPCAS